MSDPATEIDTSAPLSNGVEHENSTHEHTNGDIQQSQPETAELTNGNSEIDGEENKQKRGFKRPTIVSQSQVKAEIAATPKNDPESTKMKVPNFLKKIKDQPAAESFIQSVVGKVEADATPEKKPEIAEDEDQKKKAVFRRPTVTNQQIAAAVVLEQKKDAEETKVKAPNFLKKVQNANAFSSFVENIANKIPEEPADKKESKEDEIDTKKTLFRRPTMMHKNPNDADAKLPVEITAQEETTTKVKVPNFLKKATTTNNSFVSNIESLVEKVEKEEKIAAEKEKRDSKDESNAERKSLFRRPTMVTKDTASSEPGSGSLIDASAIIGETTTTKVKAPDFLKKAKNPAVAIPFIESLIEKVETEKKEEVQEDPQPKTLFRRPTMMHKNPNDADAKLPAEIMAQEETTTKVKAPNFVKKSKGETATATQETAEQKSGAEETEQKPAFSWGALTKNIQAAKQQENEDAKQRASFRRPSMMTAEQKKEKLEDAQKTEEAASKIKVPNFMKKALTKMVDVAIVQEVVKGEQEEEEEPDVDAPKTRAKTTFKKPTYTEKENLQSEAKTTDNAKSLIKVPSFLKKGLAAVKIEAVIEEKTANEGQEEKSSPGFKKPTIKKIETDENGGEIKPEPIMTPSSKMKVPSFADKAKKAVENNPPGEKPKEKEKVPFKRPSIAAIALKKKEIESAVQNAVDSTVQNTGSSETSTQNTTQETVQRSEEQTTQPTREDEIKNPEEVKQEQLQESQKEIVQQQPTEEPKEETTKEAANEVNQQVQEQQPQQETIQEHPKEEANEVNQQVQEQQPQQETIQEQPKEVPKQEVTEVINQVEQQTQEQPQDLQKEVVQEQPKEEVQEQPKEDIKEIPQEIPKETLEERNENIQQEPTEEVKEIPSETAEERNARIQHLLEQEKQKKEQELQKKKEILEINQKLVKEYLPQISDQAVKLYYFKLVMAVNKVQAVFRGSLARFVYKLEKMNRMNEMIMAQMAQKNKKK